MALVWNENMSVKVNEIDQQHRKLIVLIGNLEEAMSKGKGKEALGKVLGELVQYTKYHFGFEEGLMTMHQYPDDADHRQKHARLTGQVLELQVKQAAGQMGLTIPTMKFLNNWLSDHILNTDKKFGAYLNSKGVS